MEELKSQISDRWALKRFGFTDQTLNERFILLFIDSIEENSVGDEDGAQPMGLCQEHSSSELARHSIAL